MQSLKAVTTLSRTVFATSAWNSLTSKSNSNWLWSKELLNPMISSGKMQINQGASFYATKPFPILYASPFWSLVGMCSTSYRSKRVRSSTNHWSTSTTSLPQSLSRSSISSSHSSSSSWPREREISPLLTWTPLSSSKSVFCSSSMPASSTPLPVSLPRALITLIFRATSLTNWHSSWELTQ